MFKAIKKYFFWSRIKKGWLKALRSDQYQQGFGKFYDPGTNSYCALGLLLLSSGQGFNGPTFSWVDDLIGFPDTEFIENMNDRKRMTFPQIADWIEKNL